MSSLAPMSSANAGMGSRLAKAASARILRVTGVFSFRARESTGLQALEGEGVSPRPPPRNRRREGSEEQLRHRAQHLGVAVPDQERRDRRLLPRLEPLADALDRPH